MTRNQESQLSDKANSANTDVNWGDRQRSIYPDRETSSSPSVVRRSPYSSMRSPVTSPFTVMRRMADDMDRLLENIGTGRAAEVFPALATSLSRDVWNDGPASDRGIWSPQVETFRRGDKLVVRADLPGLKKEDVKVEIEDGILTISGERSDEHKEDKDGFFRTERSYGRFSRMLALPDGVSEEKCDATFNNGVLEVTLPVPKQTERKAKEIGIR